jgi:hypothetical protein
MMPASSLEKAALKLKSRPNYCWNGRRRTKGKPISPQSIRRRTAANRNSQSAYQQAFYRFADEPTGILIQRIQMQF